MKTLDGRRGLVLVRQRPVDPGDANPVEEVEPRLGFGQVGTFKTLAFAGAGFTGEHGDNTVAILAKHEGLDKMYNVTGSTGTGQYAGIWGNVTNGSAALASSWKFRGALGGMDETAVVGLVKNWTTFLGSTCADTQTTKSWPAFWRGSFKSPHKDGVFATVGLRTSGLSSGSAWVNGHNIGRFSGNTLLYVPECWLTTDNTVVIYDASGNSPTGVKLESIETRARYATSTGTADGGAGGAGGSGGSAGASGSGGATGSGGRTGAGGGGGSGGSAGASGSGGSTGSGGRIGSAGAGGGTSAGGALGSGGSVGQGGAAAGGSVGSGGVPGGTGSGGSGIAATGGAGGRAGTAGGAGEAGSSGLNSGTGGTGSSSASASTGCSCAVGGRSSGLGVWVVVGFALLLGLRRRPKSHR